MHPRELTCPPTTFWSPSSARHPLAMLLTIPVELQVNILGLLPRRDLARVVRTCRHLHAVGVTILYAHVELHSLDQVAAFFQITSLLPQGSAVASRHADAKQDQWKAIKTLYIDITEAKTKTAPLANLPRSLRGRGVERFTLDRLRLVYHDDPSALSAILQRFSPRELELHRNYHTYDRTLDQWLSSTGWQDVVQLTFVGQCDGHRIGSAATSSRLFKAKKATLVCCYWELNYYVSMGVRADASVLVRLCPNADAIDLRVKTSAAKVGVEQTIQQGLAGKPASFFSVVLMPKGSNIWGDLKGTDE